MSSDLSPGQQVQKRFGTYAKRFLKVNLWATFCLMGAVIAGDILVVHGKALTYSHWVPIVQPVLLSFVLILCLIQFIAGMVGIFSRESRNWGMAAILSVPVIAVIWLFSVFSTSSWIGGAWGRPLRLRGRQLHPQLREGSDWTRGAQPACTGLDEPTRRALEALWLHDAQKEHASVPAFSRISWMLAAVGAPAELMEWSHRAALEEIEHTRLCFALAAGYGGRKHSVEPMPELLLGGLDLKDDPFVVLAIESLADGCQLEDFNADVAAACAQACMEPVTRAVLEQIAREERSHAEFSWALLEWLISRSDKVPPAIEQGLKSLDRYPRPTAVGADKLLLVAQADAEQLMRHGRLPDSQWSQLWEARLAATRLRVRYLREKTVPPERMAA